MKALFIILILINSVNAKFEKINLENYYSISSLTSKILKIDDGELIFYGNEGNILRTYDNGETWLQNYSGTKDNIKKLIINEGIIFGVTENGNFMVSDDKGDWWKFQKLSNGFSDITIYDNKLYLTTFTDSIFISIDYGINWETYKTNTDSISNIYVFYDLILINTNSNKIYTSNNIISNWNQIELPFSNYSFTHKNNKIYINNSTTIAKLKNDLSWEESKVFSTGKNFIFLEKDEEYIIFTANVSSISDYGLETYIYNKDINNTIMISKYFDESFDFSAGQNFEIFPFDVEFSDNQYFLSNYYKTIFKSNDLKNWSILTNNSAKTNIRYLFLDDKNVFLSKRNKGFLLKSTNGGKTFKQTWKPIKDTIDNVIVYPAINNFVFKNKENGLVLFNKIANSLDGGGKTIFKRFLIMNNGEVKKLNFSINDMYITLNEIQINDFFDENYLAYSSFKIKKTVRDENNTFPDSVIRTVFYKINQNSLDTLGEIIDSIMIYNIVLKDNTVWLWGKTAIPDENNIRHSKIYNSKDSCKTFEISKFKITDDESTSLLFDKKGNYYQINDKTIIKYDNNYNLKSALQTDYDYFGIEGYNQKYIEEQVLSGIKILKEGMFEYPEYYRCNINENDELLTFEKLKDGNFYFNTISSNYFTLLKNLGIYNNLYIPIEPERLEYYSSVQKTEKSNYLWTEPPYPQPTNNIVKIDTYWDSALPFTEKDIEVYDLTGVKIKTENTLSIQKETNYNGKIIWDASTQQPGIYILKINHGTETRIRKIMVVE